MSFCHIIFMSYHIPKQLVDDRKLLLVSGLMHGKTISHVAVIFAFSCFILKVLILSSFQVS